MTDHQLAREDGHESVVDVLNLFNLRPAWQTRALCHGRLDEFYPSIGGNRKEYARALRAKFCDRCPVRRECSEAGADEPDGIWGHP